MKTILCILPLSVLLFACGNHANDNSVAAPEASALSADTIKTAHALDVYVRGNGEILVDHQLTPMDSLNKKLIALKGENGVVHYSRANPQGDPPPQCMQVLDLVVKKG